MKIGNREVEPVVVEKIREAFPSEAESILKDLKWDGLMGCYMFERWGMQIGVETDGYIHS